MVAKRLRMAVLPLAIATGLSLGALLSLWQSGRPAAYASDAANVVDRYWFTDFDIGSDEAGMLLRARTSRRGLLALKSSEAVYYTRTIDGSGQPLREDCTYRLEGGELPAGWWSVTLYADDDFLARNRDGAASVNADDFELADGRWSVLIAPDKPAGVRPWLSSHNAGVFDLTLRLYQPDPIVLSGRPLRGFPTVERVFCYGA